MKVFYSSFSRRLRWVLFACLLAGTAQAATYYVSTTGSDSQSGTQSSPFRTIAKAASLVQAGDLVLISGGTYAEQNIIPANSGLENQVIVFKSQSGTGDVILTNPAASATDMSVIFDLSNRNYVRIEGLVFKGFLYGRACIYISSGDNNAVVNNRFEDLGHEEVAASWDGNAAVFIYKSTRNSVRNNYFNNIFGDGVSVNGQQSVGNSVTDNTFLAFKGKKRAWDTAGNKFSRTIDIQDMSYGNNLFAFNYASGVVTNIWLDRDGSTNVILRNVANNSASHVFNESRCAFNVIQENIAYNLTGTAYETARYNTGWTVDGRWVNNVAYSSRPGFYIDKSYRGEFRNNISYNNGTWNFVFTQNTWDNGPRIFRNNLWYTEGNANSIQFLGNAVSAASFQNSVEETGGLSVNPQFTNLTTGAEDFTLQSSSPAKGAGYEGVDMGAYAVYGKTSVGWDQAFQPADVEVNFDVPISASKRGVTAPLIVKLSKSSTQAVTLDIIPVAGDARTGEDFQLTQSVSFQPGETTKTVNVAVLGGSNFNELVAFRLSNVVNATPGHRDLCVLHIEKNVNAGPDQTFVYNGSPVSVTLDGSATEGSIVSYTWSENGSQIATGVNPTVQLGQGTHNIILTATFANGSTYTDNVIIFVKINSDVFIEAECRDVGTLWNIQQDASASNGKYVTIEKGNNSSASAPSTVSGQITYSFNVIEAGNYILSLRTICPDASGDSFWIKVDDQAFESWNDITNSDSWIWVQKPSIYTLAVGSHTLTIAYREDDAKIDKILLSMNGTQPDGVGAEATNCQIEEPVQKVAVKTEAESGVLGSDWDIKDISGLKYITAKTDRAADNFPGNATKVATYSVTFPQAGTYHLYLRFRVGTGAANDDSFYYGNGFGQKDPATNADWITCNSFSGNGYNVATDIVAGTKGAVNNDNNIWKWINLSQFAGTGSEAAITFTVPADALRQTFQFGSRENGFDIDKIVFGIAESTFTVAELNGVGGINHAPVIAASQTFTVQTISNAGATVGTVSASDIDADAVLSGWKIVGGSGMDLFSIDAATGVITVADNQASRLAELTTYTLLIKVNDGLTPSVVETVNVVVDSNMPVVLVRFDARAAENHVAISWETAEEINNGRFDVLKSTDGIHFQLLTSVTGNNQASKYMVIDENPIDGHNYYSLVQYDIDGTFTKFGIRHVKFGDNSKMKVYPNPVQESIYVNLGQSFLEASLVDINGTVVRKIGSSQKDNVASMPVSDLKQGIYILKVRTAVDTFTNFKVIKVNN